MEDISGGKMIKAFVPLAEMFGYATDLTERSVTICNLLRIVMLLVYI